MDHAQINAPNLAERYAIAEAVEANRRAETAERECDRLRAALAKVEMAALVDESADLMAREQARISAFNIARKALAEFPR